MENPAIITKNLSKVYRNGGEIYAVRDVNIEIKKGEFDIVLTYDILL